MKLETYLSKTQKTPAAFAIELGKSSASGVMKWLRMERTPRPHEMRRIFDVTNGKVTPNDFILRQPAAPKAERVA